MLALLGLRGQGAGESVTAQVLSALRRLPELLKPANVTNIVMKVAMHVEEVRCRLVTMWQ